MYIPPQVVADYKRKFKGLLMDIWPSIYTMLNDFLRGTINLIKDIIGSVFKW